MNLIALRSSQFRKYFFGAVCAVNGIWILFIILGWLSWEISGSASFVGTVAAVGLIPTVLFGPFFGVLVDRANVLKAALVTNGGVTLCVLALYYLQVSEQVTPKTLVIISFCIGTFNAAHHPVRMSLGPRLVKAQYVNSVIALAALNFNLARFIAPAIAGVLIETIGILPSTLLAAAAYVPNVLVLRFLAPREKPVKEEPENFRQAFVIGIKYLLTRPSLRLVILATALFTLSIRGVLEVLPIIADGVFELGVAGLGQMGSAVGAGALCAALLKAFKRGPVFASAQAFSGQNMAALVIGILALAVLGNSQIWPIALAATSVLGFCGTHLGVSMQSLIQTNLPDDMRGRVMSIWIVVGLGGAALGAYSLGLFSELFGLPVATSGIAIGGLIIIGIIMLQTQKKEEAKDPL